MTPQPHKHPCFHPSCKDGGYHETPTFHNDNPQPHDPLAALTPEDRSAVEEIRDYVEDEWARERISHNKLSALLRIVERICGAYDERGREIDRLQSLVSRYEAALKLIANSEWSCHTSIAQDALKGENNE